MFTGCNYYFTQQADVNGVLEALFDKTDHVDDVGDDAKNIH